MASVNQTTRRRRLMGEINVVPYIDVMLVLLIIFMVTAPLLNLGVDIELPQSDARPLEQRQDPVVVSVDPEGQMSLDKSHELCHGFPPCLSDALSVASFESLGDLSDQRQQDVLFGLEVIVHEPRVQPGDPRHLGDGGTAVSLRCHHPLQGAHDLAAAL